MVGGMWRNEHIPMGETLQTWEKQTPESLQIQKIWSEIV